jgi:hypothetical protein
VDIINNTSYLNNVSEPLKWGEIFAQVSGNCNVHNNIAYFRPGNNPGMMTDRNSNVVYSSNILFNGTLREDLIPLNITSDPMFTDAENGDFSLLPSSPAHGAADAHWAKAVGNETGKLGVFGFLGIAKQE